MACGAEEIKDTIEKHLGIKDGGEFGFTLTTYDGTVLKPKSFIQRQLQTDSSLCAKSSASAPARTRPWSR